MKHISKLRHRRFEIKNEAYFEVEQAPGWSFVCLNVFLYVCLSIYLSVCLSFEREQSVKIPNFESMATPESLENDGRRDAGRIPVELVGRARTRSEPANGIRPRGGKNQCKQKPWISVCTIKQKTPRATSKEMEAAAEQEPDGEEETTLDRLRVQCRMLEVKNKIKQRYRCLKETPEILTTAQGRDKGAGQALKMTDCPYGKAGSNCSAIIGEESREDKPVLVVEKITKGLSFERVIGLDEYWHLKALYKAMDSHVDVKALVFLSTYSSDSAHCDNQ
jgi:hypothetical protein